jgi:nicotinate-nucleotide adenylyltransferase
MRQIGLFGGSFDPIHFGHIHLAVRMLETGILEEVLFCPASVSPFKSAQLQPAPAEHRLNMLRLAIEEIPRCKVLECEIYQKNPSYTVDTVRYLNRELGSEVQLRLLLGADTVRGFDQWKEVESLVELAPPLVWTRNFVGQPGSLEAYPKKVKEALEKGSVSMPALEISSTEIRQRVKKRLYCGHLVPAKVLDYIHQNQLYYL